MTNGHRGTVQPSPPTHQDEETLRQRKAEARRQAGLRRAALAPKTEAGSGLRDRAMTAITLAGARKRGRVDGCPVSAFWPLGSEIDTRPLMEVLHAQGHGVGLPVMLARGRPLIFRAWEPGLSLIPGGFGTQIPGPGQPEMRPEVLFVPMLAFDRAGYRLGYGGGFYDRTLAALRAKGSALAVGLAYAGQEVPEVPHGAHDQRLDWIVTESEAIQIV